VRGQPARTAPIACEIDYHWWLKIADLHGRRGRVAAIVADVALD
jgi:hypothetical protein